MRSYLFEEVLKGPWIKSGDDAHYKIQNNTLYFPGTFDRHGWRHDFDFAIAPYKNMDEPWLAHRGFVTLYKSISDEIKEKVKSFDALTIVGYSQGAALATLAHEDIGFNLHHISINTYAYASPRVLWMPPKRIEERFARLVRYTIHGDIVTMVPPLVMGYKHVGEEYKIGPLAVPWWTHHRPEEYIKGLME